MNTRVITTIMLAIVLICFVMGVAGFMTYIGWAGTEKFSARNIWQHNYPGSQSMKIIDLTGDGKDDLFIQNTGNISILDANGQVIFSQDLGGDLVSTLGDLNGDGTEDVLALHSSEGGSKVLILSRGQPIYDLVVDLGVPARAAIIQFASGPQIILGDTSGNLLALNPQGEVLWRGAVGSGDAVRGLDNVKVNGLIGLAAANHNGAVNFFSENGQAVWDYFVAGGLRRLRAYDLNGDGASEILLGGENGQYVMLNAANGSEIFTKSLGQAVTEIRQAEANGDPASREVIVGGKNGGVWAFTYSGEVLWQASLSDKVTEIAGVDLNSDGAEEIIIGDESGAVTLFIAPRGERTTLADFNAPINRIDAGRLTAARQIVVANSEQVYLYSLAFEQAPALQFTPLIAGLFASLVIAGVAWFIATLPPKPALRLAIEDNSSEGLLAQRRMLKENIADVERLKSRGEMTSDAYLARLKELRRQLAGNDAAMRKAGMQFTPETFPCPNCGGALQLGEDRCDYCGQTIIL